MARKPEIRCTCEPADKVRFDMFWKDHGSEFDFDNKGELMVYLINELIDEHEKEGKAAKLN